jgi:hypothetical protein
MASLAAASATPADASTSPGAPAAWVRPAWLAWALRAPVALVSGFTHALRSQDLHRCPRRAGTPRPFACTLLIAARQAIRRVPGFGPRANPPDTITRKAV